ncbi:MAG: 6-bladed beta-propeller, partial [bacterium]
GSWGSGNGKFHWLSHAAVAASGTVYVADGGNHRVQYFTPTGSFLGKWGSRDGAGAGISLASDGTVFITGNERVLYFTSSGSFLGSFGKWGEGPGEFWGACDLAVTEDGRRLYVADHSNFRVQNFDQTIPAVVPDSLGRVKALFK